MENSFYKGEFRDDALTGRGIFFYSDNQDYYLGEVKDGVYHGKGLYYHRVENTWELNDYKEGKVNMTIKTGEGRPQSLEISKEIMADQDPTWQEIYIKPKDVMFEHYEVSKTSLIFIGRCYRW